MTPQVNIMSGEESQTSLAKTKCLVWSDKRSSYTIWALFNQQNIVPLRSLLSSLEPSPLLHLSPCRPASRLPSTAACCSRSCTPEVEQRLEDGTFLWFFFFPPPMRLFFLFVRFLHLWTCAAVFLGQVTPVKEILISMGLLICFLKKKVI